MQVLIEVSARHIHLTQEAVEILFGVGSVLEPRKELTQPGLFACKQRVDVIGPRGTIQQMTILAPVRNYCQVEVSKTDARALGIAAPVRESGNLEGTPGCTLVGPQGSLTLDKGVIVARRHVHMKQDEADAMGIQSGDIVSLEVDEGERSLIFKDLIVRASPKLGGTFAHIDTDEANAASINKAAYGTLIPLK